MLRPVGISSSGISASFKLLDTAAHNIANANTDGFKRLSVTFNEGAEGGVRAAVSKDPGPGNLYRVDDRVFEASNVDMASETVSLMTARHMLSLNLAVLKTADEMEKSFLDTFV